jgi:CheY-like chemotaxis protein
MKYPPTAEPILIAEDNPDDAFLLRMALERNETPHPIHIVENGLEVIKYLCGEPPYQDRTAHPFPSVVYTDLKMPLKDGFEVLDWVKKHPECYIIPVIILTSSDEDRDVRRAYQLGANSYIVKPGTLTQLTEIIGVSLRYWKFCTKPLHLQKC